MTSLASHWGLVPEPGQPTAEDHLMEGLVEEVEDALAAYRAEPSKANSYRLNVAQALLSTYESHNPELRAWQLVVRDQARETWARAVGCR